MAENPKETIGGRVPPHNLQAEEATLCTCLDSENALAIVAALLSREDFYKPAHKIIFSAILELYTQQSPVDLITVSDLLARRGELEAAGGAPFLSYLSDLPVLRANANEYAGIVRQKAMLRKLIGSLDEVIKLSFDGEQEANNLVDLAIKRLSDMRENPTGGDFEKAYDIISRTVQEINDIIKGKKEQRTIKTGFAGMDRALGGLKPGTLTVVAARPGVGKSALVINIATQSAVNYGTSVAFFSLEMSKKEIGNRILSSRSSVSTDALQNAKLDASDFEKIGEAIIDLSPAPFYIDDRSGINTIEMMAKCRQLKNQNKLDLVIVDYLQLMSSAINRGGNRQQEISEISRSLKIMAKDLDVPLIALSQLSRGAEYREDRRPQLSDLRDSGAIEQDADVVLFIYREKYYDSGQERMEIEDAEIIISKNRQGPTRTVPLKWWAKRTLFFEPDYRGYDDSASPPPKRNTSFSMDQGPTSTDAGVPVEKESVPEPGIPPPPENSAPPSPEMVYDDSDIPWEEDP